MCRPHGLSYFVVFAAAASCSMNGQIPTTAGASSFLNFRVFVIVGHADSCLFIVVAVQTCDAITRPMHVSEF